MKKTVFTIIFAIILMSIMLFIPNSVNAETKVEFDYSKIKASTDLAFPKLYELDSSVGEILSQDWKDDIGESLFSSYKGFEIGKTYTYTAEIKLNDPDAFIEIINPPPSIQGSSYSVSRLEGDTIGIEIVTVIPKEYKLTVNITDGITIDGITPNVPKEFTVYEMEEINFDIKLEDGYEIVSATANGNEIFENDAYFEYTNANIFENKLRVWNINTDIEIFINAEKIKPVLKINLLSNDIYVGDSAEDVKFEIDYKGFKISKVEVGELAEVDNEVEFKEFTGKFEANKKYIAGVTLKANITQEEIERILEEYSSAVLYYNDLPLDLEVVSDDEVLVFCELVIKEERPIQENNKENLGEKDDSPKTGADLTIVYIILGIATLGVVFTNKKIK